MKFSTRKPRKTGLGILLFATVALCGSAHATDTAKRSFRLPDGETLESYRMSTSARTPELIYITYSEKTDPKIEHVDAGTWNGKSTTAAKRYSYLWDAYLANSDAKGNTILHSVCFTGDPALFVNAFFGPKTVVANLDAATGLATSMSSDRYLIGVTGRFTPPKQAAVPFHFRLPSCFTPGKGDLVANLGSKIARNPSSDVSFVPFTATEKTELKAMIDTKIQNRVPQSDLSKGFDILDVATDATGLGKFTLSADYDKASWKGDARDRPWKNMRIDTLDGQRKFADMMRDYIYDGMVNNGGSAESVLYPEKSTNRYWCNMPWLNVGKDGREAIHGLTKERPLNKSPMYPGATYGSDWGIGFYNAPGCKGIMNVFGTRSNPKTPNYSPWDVGGGNTAYFPDGTVAVKFLFTMANFPALAGTHVVQANTTFADSEPTRKIRPARLLQIDVAVKDSTLVGAHKALDYWVMTTYYYDAAYNSPSSLSGVPDGFQKMRPQGIQLGLGTGPTESVTFPGSLANGLEGRLDGPADNSKGSCLGCHSTAGTSTAMVPGFLDDAGYGTVRATALDFSQQLALAKRNQQTQ